MTIDESLSFLAAHQPMPPEAELSQELIEKYEEVRQWLLSHYDVRCVPLLLGSFGEGDGYGVYQLVDEVIRMYPHEYVVEQLLKALDSNHCSVRTWSMEMAAWFPDARLRSRVSELAESGDEDERVIAQGLLTLIARAEVSQDSRPKSRT